MRMEACGSLSFSKGIGTTRSRLEVSESVVRNTRAEQVLEK